MWRDTGRTYGALSIINHWLAAAIAIALLGSGLIFEEMARGDARTAILQFHNSLGTLTALYILFRIYWRGRSGFPAEPPGPHWQALAARLVHWLMIASLLLLTVSGPVILWAVDRAAPLFGLGEIPSFLPYNHDVHEALETAHAITAKFVLLPLLALHIAAALKRALIDRDGTLSRMTRPGE